MNPRYKQPLILLKAIRNGLVYGTKVRFPHALVMVFLFRSGPIRERAYIIYKATRQHATNLAKFALLYKSGCLLLKNLNAGKEASLHPFISGLNGGYWVFGAGKGGASSVNQQICMYVFARVVLALAKMAVVPPSRNTLVGGNYGGGGGRGFLKLSEEQSQLVQEYSWPVFASLSWAGVMWLFRWYPDTLQPSLRSSMTYMYVFTLPSFSLDTARDYSACVFTAAVADCYRCVDTRTQMSGRACGISCSSIHSAHCYFSCLSTCICEICPLSRLYIGYHLQRSHLYIDVYLRFTDIVISQLPQLGVLA